MCHVHMHTAHTDFICILRATLCETYSGLVTHTHTHAPDSRLTKVFKEAIAQICTGMRWIESSHRQKKRLSERERERNYIETHNIDYTQYDYAQNLIVFLSEEINYTMILNAWYCITTKNSSKWMTWRAQKQWQQHQQLNNTIPNLSSPCYFAVKSEQQ